MLVCLYVSTTKGLQMTEMCRHMISIVLPCSCAYHCSLTQWHANTCSVQKKNLVFLPNASAPPYANPPKMQAPNFQKKKISCGGLHSGVVCRGRGVGNHHLACNHRGPPLCHTVTGPTTSIKETLAGSSVCKPLNHHKHANANKVHPFSTEIRSST